jgi:hypothetical protein
MVPQGMKAQGLELHLTVTPTGSAGTGTDGSHAVIKAIKIENEMGEVVASFNSGLAAAVAAGLQGLIGQDSDAIPADGADVYSQSGVLAGNTAVNSLFRWLLEKGAYDGRIFTITVDFFLPTLAGYSTPPTSYTASINLVVLAINESQAEASYIIAAQEINSQTKFALEDGSVGSIYHHGAILSTSQLDTNLSGYTHGEPYNSEQIAEIERTVVNNATISGVTIVGATYFVLLTKRIEAAPVQATSTSAISAVLVGKRRVR